MKFPVIAFSSALALLAVLASPTDAAKKKKETAPPTPAPAVARELTVYFCTIWHEISFDSAAAPVLAPVGYVPIPHMGNISMYKESGVKVPRPVDMWNDDHDEHDHALVKAPDTAAKIDTAAYVLNWLDLKGGQVKYEYLTVREDHKGPIKPFFAGMGGNLYIGTCDRGDDE